jgi:hypothetical protein
VAFTFCLTLFQHPSEPKSATLKVGALRTSETGEGRGEFQSSRDARKHKFIFYFGFFENLLLIRFFHPEILNIWHNLSSIKRTI